MIDNGLCPSAGATQTISLKASGFSLDSRLARGPPVICVVCLSPSHHLRELWSDHWHQLLREKWASHWIGYLKKTGHSIKFSQDHGLYCQGFHCHEHIYFVLV